VADRPFTLRAAFRGEAGDGILSAGDTLMRAAAALGFSASVHKSFPPTIRGGACGALVTISDAETAAPVSASVDFVFELDKSILTVYNIGNDNGGGGVDGVNTAQPVDKSSITGHSDDIPESFEINFGLCPHIHTHPQLKSSFALGMISSVLGIPKNPLLKLITEKLMKKNLTEQNTDAFERGHGFASSKINTKHRFAGRLSTPNPVSGDRVIIDGNQAVALGAIAAGCRFYASYPITPATSIGEFLARTLPDFGGFAYQAEDEISAIGAVAGAWFSGVPAMTATSGPGLSLMQEFLGYCSMTEIPAVVADVQRAGPSTGMPTKHSQDDLLAAAFGGHGEGQRVVLAAADIDDCFYLTMEAFGMARRFRCPVILLSDSALGHLRATRKRPDHSVSTGTPSEQSCIDDGSSHNIAGTTPRHPYIARRVTGLEHDGDGIPDNSAANRIRQQERRFRKMDAIYKEYGRLHVIDTAGIDRGEADLCVVSWGFSASLTRHAVDNLRCRGIKIACLYPKLLFPLVKKHYLDLYKLCPRIAVVESNYTGQLASLIRMYTGIDTIPVNQYRGEPFTPEEIEAALYDIYTGGNGGTQNG